MKKSACIAMVVLFIFIGQAFSKEFQNGPSTSGAPGLSCPADVNFTHNNSVVMEASYRLPATKKCISSDGFSHIDVLNDYHETLCISVHATSSRGKWHGIQIPEGETYTFTSKNRNELWQALAYPCNDKLDYIEKWELQFAGSVTSAVAAEQKIATYFFFNYLSGHASIDQYVDVFIAPQETSYTKGDIFNVAPIEMRRRAENIVQRYVTTYIESDLGEHAAPSRQEAKNKVNTWFDNRVAEHRRLKNAYQSNRVVLIDPISGTIIREEIINKEPKARRSGAGRAN